MKTITMQTQIAADGKLCFELATELPPGPADVVVIVQPSVPAPAPHCQPVRPVSYRGAR